MTAPRTSGAGRRFELVLLRLRPPSPRTIGMIAKHASEDSYHWVLVLGRVHATTDNLARLLAVAYLDEASGLLGRGDPRWSVPRACLRASGLLETRPDEGRAGGSPDDFARAELRRIAAWLRRRHQGYLADLRDALQDGPPDERFRTLEEEGRRARGIVDPTGRGLLAPDPPPVATRTRSGPQGEDDAEAPDLPAWRVASARRR